VADDGDAADPHQAAWMMIMRLWPRPDLTIRSGHLSG
jgi:hypothetical protein